MIKKLFSLTALLLLMASCANDIDQASQLRMRAGDAPVFYATIEGSSDAETKVFADSKMRVLWNANDLVSIFNKKTGNSKFRFTGEDGDNAGGFTYVSGSLSGTAIDHIYSVYPFSKTTTISNEGVLSLTLPATQTYKESSFGIGTNTMVSVSEDSHLRFKNVCGYLSFRFYGDGISVKSITLKGNNGEKLAGKANITMPVGGTPTVVMQDGATESITLTCETPIALGADANHFTEFWFVIPPTTLTKGFTVTVTDDQGGVFQMSSAKERVIERNKLSRMAALKVVFENVPLVVSTIPNDSRILYPEGGSDNVLINGPSFWNAVVSKGGDWCSIAAGDDHLQITTSRNESGKIREAEITITSGYQKKTFPVYQTPFIRTITPYPSRRVRMQECIHYENRDMACIAVFMPYPETNEYQTIENITFSSPGAIRVTKEQNARYVLFQDYPAERTGDFVCTLEYTATSNLVEVNLKNITRYFEYDKQSPSYQRYTSTLIIDEQKFIDPDNPTLSAIADELWTQVDGDLIAYCRACYDYVATHFEYMSGGNGVIQDILDRGGGDCGNINNLFLSMVRHKGIPARAIVMEQPVNNNHVRGEFYLAGYGWIPVDTTFHMGGGNYFGVFTDNYIVMNRDLGLTCKTDDWQWGWEGTFSILQGCNWLWWCYSDGGDVTGDYLISEITE